MSDAYTFLYVEDDQISRTVMQMILRHHFASATLIMFEDSRDFENRVNTLPAKPDIIFLDIHMTPYTGFEMLRMLREHPVYHDCRVVALTASVMSEEIEKLAVAGFNGAIAKPLNREMFPKLITKIIQGDLIWHIT